MPRPLQFLVLLCLFLLVVFFGVGSLLADRWRVETTRRIAAEPARIHSALLDLDAWQKWCTLDAALGPNTTRTVSGPAGQPGASITWRGQGEAVLRLTAVEPGRSLTYEFATAAAGVLSSGGLVLSPAEGGTDVTWWEAGIFPSTTMRWFGWFGAVQEAMRNHEAKSLANLQQRLEEPKAAGK